jgi:hypothetical protein
MILALVWGARGRQFESGLPDKEYQEIGTLFLCLKLNTDKGFMEMSVKLKCSFQLVLSSIVISKISPSHSNWVTNGSRFGSQVS